MLFCCFILILFYFGLRFKIEGLKVTFKFEEVPIDMKILAMLPWRVSYQTVPSFFPHLQMIYQKKIVQI